MRMTRALILCLTGGIFLLSSGVQAGEKEELALVLKQLDQVQAGFERARVVAVQDGQSARFYFDHQRAMQDITTIRKGIEHYLEPSRTQPVSPLIVSGLYRQEKR